MSLFEVITAAVNDLIEHGYDSPERIAKWAKAIRDAAVSSLTPEWQMKDQMVAALQAKYRSFTEDDATLRQHVGVSRFTREMIKPKLLIELDKSVAASAGLIKLNREQAIEKTIQRFSGWASSIPSGGSDAGVDRVAQKQLIRKSLTQLPFEERRVLIDQSRKFSSSLNNILATDGGAIAVIWHSHWRRPGYRFRIEHKDRDGLFYALKGNWAIERGLMKKGPAGYYEDVTAFGQEPFCSCDGQYVYALSKLPSEMITAKGRAELERVRGEISEGAI